MRKLSDELKEKIKTKVQAFETGTCLELVPVIVKRSSDYLSTRILIFIFAFFLSYEIFQLWLNVWDPRVKFVTAVALGMCAGFLACFGPIFRCLIPKPFKHHKVEQQALRSFMLNEVFATKSRTGILVLVSEFERSVFVLADKGVVKHIPEAEFKALGAKLAKDFDSDSPGESFFAAFAELAHRVAPHFPPDASGNELDDNLRSR